MFGSTISAVGIIKELICEIQCLQQENLQLRHSSASVRNFQRSKRCYKCGRDGHLERACCAKVTKYDGNWRTNGADNAPVTVNETVDEGFGSPGSILEPSEQMNTSQSVEQDGDDQFELSPRDDGVSSGKSDQDSDTDRYSSTDCEPDESSQASSADSDEAASESEEDGMYDDAEEASPTRPRKLMLQILEDIDEDLANPKIADALGLIGEIFDSLEPG